jgi:hypothetical protein
MHEKELNPTAITATVGYHSQRQTRIHQAPSLATSPQLIAVSGIAQTSVMTRKSRGLQEAVVLLFGFATRGTGVPPDVGRELEVLRAVRYGGGVTCTEGYGVRGKQY